MPKNAPDTLRAVQATQAFQQPIGATVDLIGGLASAPAGYLACNGQIVPRASYPALSALLGTDQRLPISFDSVHPKVGCFEQPWDFLYFNSNFVVSGNTGVAISADGIAWRRTLVTPDWVVIHRLRVWNNLIFAIGVEVSNSPAVTAGAVNAQGNGTGKLLLWSSPDGVTWTQVNFPPASLANANMANVGFGISDICYGNSLYLVTFYGDGALRYATSPDLVNWTFNTYGGTGVSAWNTASCTYFNGRFLILNVANLTNYTKFFHTPYTGIAGASASAQIVYSTTGAQGSWSAGVSLDLTSGGVHARTRFVIANGTLFVMGVRYVYVSTDGIAFTKTDITAGSSTSQIASVMYWQGAYHFGASGANNIGATTVGTVVARWYSTAATGPMTAYSGANDNNHSQADNVDLTPGRAYYMPQAFFNNILVACSSPTGTAIWAMPLGMFEYSTSVTSNVPNFNPHYTGANTGTNRRCAYIGKGLLQTLPNGTIAGGLYFYFTDNATAYSHQGLFTIDTAGIVHAGPYIPTAIGAYQAFRVSYHTLGGQSLIRWELNGSTAVHSLDNGATYWPLLGGGGLPLNTAAWASDGQGTVATVNSNDQVVYCKIQLDQGTNLGGAVTLTNGLNNFSAGYLPTTNAQSIVWTGTQWIVACRDTDGSTYVEEKFLAAPQIEGPWSTIHAAGYGGSTSAASYVNAAPLGVIGDMKMIGTDLWVVDANTNAPALRRAINQDPSAFDVSIPLPVSPATTTVSNSTAGTSFGALSNVWGAATGSNLPLGSMAVLNSTAVIACYDGTLIGANVRTKQADIIGAWRIGSLGQVVGGGGQLPDGMPFLGIAQLGDYLYVGGFDAQAWGNPAQDNGNAFNAHAKLLEATDSTVNMIVPRVTPATPDRVSYVRAS